MQAYVNDTFLSLNRAVLQVGDLAIQRGYGVFDFFRVHRRVPLYLNDYLDRFYNSAAVMGLNGPLEREKLSNTILELIDRNELEDAGIKMILTGGYSPDGYLPARANLVITEHPLTLPTAEQRNRGIKVITHEYRRDIPHAKTINYTMGIWLQGKVQEQNASDVLYYLNGEVSEFPRCNFFLVTQDNILVTPHNHILHGVTRKKILQIAKSHFSVEERTVTLEDLTRARELFLTSTTKRILPIVQLDDHVVGNGTPGRMTQSLSELLLEFEQNELTAHSVHP